MSRIGRMPIPIPKGVQVTIQGSTVTVQGPKGQLVQTLHPKMHVERVDGSIVVRRPDDSKASKSLHGLSQRLIANMVQGVTEGYQKSIEVVGVGYRVQKAGEKLQLQVGLSHLVEVIAPPGVQLVVEGANRIHVQGIDKQLVGETAAQIRRMRPADPYKGKGLRYAGETIRLKAGKTAAKKKA